MAIPVYEEFGGLPEFTLGPVRERPELNEQPSVFDGPWYQQEISEDRPTYWSCSVICDPRQSRAFQNFIEEVVGVNAGFFKKSIITETGKTQQLLRITSGIPQGRQIRNTAWRFDFVVMTARINYSSGDVPDPSESELDLIPTVWRYIDMRAVFGLNPGAATCVDASADGQVCYFGFDSGRAARTFFGGIGFKELPRYLGTGSTGAIRDIKCSANGKTVLAIFSTGHAALSKDAGRTWSELPQYLNSGANSPLQPRAAAVSDDGQIMAVVFDNGYASRSTNGGTSWTAMPQGLGSGATSTYFATICMSADGAIMYAGGSDGRAAKSSNSGTSWMGLAQNLGIDYDASNDIIKMRCSDTGGILIASVGGNVATSSDGGINWLKYAQEGSGTAVVEMSPRGQNAMASRYLVGGQYSRYTYGAEFGSSFIEIDPWYLTNEAYTAGVVNELKACQNIWFAAQASGHAAYSDRSAPQPERANYKFIRGLNVITGDAPITEFAGTNEDTFLATSTESSYAFMLHRGYYYLSGARQITYMRSTDAGKTWHANEYFNISVFTQVLGLAASPNGKYVIALIGTTMRVSDDYGLNFWYVEPSIGSQFDYPDTAVVKGVCIDNDGYIAISARKNSDGTGYVMVSNVPMGGIPFPGSTTNRDQDFTVLTTADQESAITGGYSWRTQKLKSVTQTTYVDVDPANQVLNGSNPTLHSCVSQTNDYAYIGEATYAVGGADSGGRILPAPVLRSKIPETGGYDDLNVDGTCVVGYNNFVFVAGVNSGGVNAIMVSDDSGETFETIEIIEGSGLMAYSDDYSQRYGNNTQMKQIKTCKTPEGLMVVLAIMYGGPNNLVRGVR